MSGLRRWATSLAIVLLVHALLIGAACWWATRAPVLAATAPPAALMLELAPMAQAPPVPPREVATGPLQQQQQRRAPKPALREQPEAPVQPQGDLPPPRAPDPTPRRTPPTPTSRRPARHHRWPPMRPRAIPRRRRRPASAAVPRPPGKGACSGTCRSIVAIRARPSGCASRRGLRALCRGPRWRGLGVEAGPQQWLRAA